MVKVDVVVYFTDGETNGSFRTTEYIKYCIQMYPSFKSNVIFFKYLLCLWGLNNSYTGGLNAYGLCLFYQAYLMKKQKITSTNYIDTIFGFIEFLLSFEYSTKAINVNLPETLVSK